MASELPSFLYKYIWIITSCKNRQRNYFGRTYTFFAGMDHMSHTNENQHYFGVQLVQLRVAEGSH